MEQEKKVKERPKPALTAQQISEIKAAKESQVKSGQTVTK